MQRLDRILAVIDPTVDAHAGATKAARLARLSGAALELFISDFDPSLASQPFLDEAALRRLREEVITERLEQLEARAEELRETGLEVTTHVHWDNPLHEGILRRVAEAEPDLVFKDTHYHSALRRALFSNTDWNLIRLCPVPLLLSRTADWGPRLKLLAAVLSPWCPGSTRRPRSITTSSTRRSSWRGNSTRNWKQSTFSSPRACWPARPAWRGRPWRRTSAVAN
jgi:universal stress protein E